MDFNDQVARSLQTNPGDVCLEFGRKLYTRSQISQWGIALNAILAEANIPTDSPVGLVVRNRPLQAAALVGLIAAGRSVSLIYAFQSSEALADDIAKLGMAAVIADMQDWSEAALGAVAAANSLGIALDNDQLHVAKVSETDSVKEAPRREPFPEPGIEILSSGTTGTPKRILLRFRVMTRFIATARAAAADQVQQVPDIHLFPLTSIGGISALLSDFVLGRYTALIEKFDVENWREAVKRLRPTYATCPPTALRMVLDAGVPPEDLASLRYIFGGGTKLDAELQDEFESTYHVKVIWAYGATEFCGTIAAWTPALRERFWQSKRGAAGCALDNISLRTVDVKTGAPLPVGQEGFLEALVPDISEDWIRTTDLAVIDADGFLFHCGRGDGAITRGGFKVLPEKIVEVMTAHPAIQDIGVVGIPDRRLGQVPVAAVQLRRGHPAVSVAELEDYARRHLMAYQIPVRFVVLDELPRTRTYKIDLASLQVYFTKNTAEMEP